MRMRMLVMMRRRRGGGYSHKATCRGSFGGDAVAAAEDGAVVNFDFRERWIMTAMSKLE
jgi:hypothetical protein